MAQHLGDERLRVELLVGVGVLLGQDGEVQALLAAEVARDQRRVDPGALADLADRGAVVAALVEQRSCGIEQRRRLAAASCGRRRPLSLRGRLDVITLLTLPREPAHRQHYNLTFAVLALAGCTFALLQSLVAPGAARDPATSCTRPPTAVAWVLTAYLLSASVCTPIIGRLGDMFGKERTLVAVAERARRRARCIAALAQLDRGADPRPRHPGRRRRGLPARLRDHPRRVPARARGRGHRDDLGDPGHRRRARASCSPARSSTRSPTTGCSGSRSSRSIVAAIATHLVRPRVADQDARARSTGRGAALLSAWLVCLLVAISEGSDWGWTERRVDRPVRRRRRPAAVLWVRNEPRAAEPLVDMKMMRIRGVWTVNAAAFLRRRRDVLARSS